MSKFSKPKIKPILCVGLCILDIIYMCDEYPIEDTKLFIDDGYWQRGGNASNNCTVLRQLGADCEFLGTLSDATAFSILSEDCRKRGIVIDNCPHVAIDQSISSIILSKSKGTRTIVNTNKNFPYVTFEHFDEHIDLKKYSWIHFEARNSKETLQMMKKIHKFNSQLKAKTDVLTISLDLEFFEDGNLELAELSDYVFLAKDFAVSFGWNKMLDAVFCLKRKLKPQNINECRKPHVICPWGDKGVCLLDRQDNYVGFKAIPQTNVVDSLGAGDTFCAATIYALNILKFNIKDAVVFGNRCASYKLGYRGYDAIAKFMKNK